MAQRKSQRFFIERSNQDAKSELGWDEFQGIKYRGWQHHLAFTILASWFITETRLDWIADHPRDPFLLEHYGTDVLPNLSLANVRTLLRAAMPLPQLSPQQAAALVVEHLDNRTVLVLLAYAGSQSLQFNVVVLLTPPSPPLKGGNCGSSPSRGRLGGGLIPW